MGDFLIYQQDGGIVTLTMNQPEARNPLTGNTAVEEFVQACKRIGADPGVKVVVLTGAGSAFCSGGNVKNMQRYSVDRDSANCDPRRVRVGHSASTSGFVPP